jgi:hypothetical protein
VRLKIPLLTILFLLLLTRISYAQTPMELPDAQSNDYGIEPEQFYPGSLVLELMEAAEAEIDAAVREAYAEGYKAAALRFMPELAAKNQEIVMLNLTIGTFKNDRRKYWRNIFIGGGLSFLGGMAVGVIITGR